MVLLIQMQRGRSRHKRLGGDDESLFEGSLLQRVPPGTQRLVSALREAQMGVISELMLNDAEQALSMDHVRSRRRKRRPPRSLPSISMDTGGLTGTSASLDESIGEDEGRRLEVLRRFARDVTETGVDDLYGLLRSKSIPSFSTTMARKGSWKDEAQTTYTRNISATVTSESFAERTKEPLSDQAMPQVGEGLPPLESVPTLDYASLAKGLREARLRYAKNDPPERREGQAPGGKRGVKNAAKEGEDGVKELKLDYASLAAAFREARKRGARHNLSEAGSAQLREEGEGRGADKEEAGRERDRQNRESPLDGAIGVRKDGTDGVKRGGQRGARREGGGEANAQQAAEGKTPKAAGRTMVDAGLEESRHLYMQDENERRDVCMSWKGQAVGGEACRSEGVGTGEGGKGEVERKELVKEEWDRVRRMSLEIRQEASSVRRELEYEEPLRLRAFKVRIVCDDLAEAHRLTMYIVCVWWQSASDVKIHGLWWVYSIDTSL